MKSRFECAHQIQAVSKASSFFFLDTADPAFLPAVEAAAVDLALLLPGVVVVVVDRRFLAAPGLLLAVVCLSSPGCNSVGQPLDKHSRARISFCIIRSFSSRSSCLRYSTMAAHSRFNRPHRSSSSAIVLVVAEPLAASYDPKPSTY
jgi:hypothetical protein